MLNPRRIGAEEASPGQFQLKAEQIMNRHRTMDDSVIVREAMSKSSNQSRDGASTIVGENG